MNYFNPKPSLRSMSTFFAVLMAAVVTWMQLNRSRWHEQVAWWKHNLMTLAPITSSSQQEWNDLPLPVQKYLLRVFSGPETWPLMEKSPPLLLVRPPVCPQKDHYAQIHQQGQMLMGKQKWIPFTAKQVISPSGFLWEALFDAVNAPWPFQPLTQITVIDAFSKYNGGLLQASWMKVLTFVSSTGLPQDAVYRGEAMRFLSEAALMPSLLLPSSGLVEWINKDSSNAAILRLRADPTIQITVTFDDYGWMTRVEGLRPKIEGTDRVHELDWGGIFSDYRYVQGRMWAPSHMGAGWKNKDDWDFYFRGDNLQIDYMSRCGEKPMTL